MIKMIIQMDEEKLLQDPELTEAQIEAALNRIFTQMGMTKVDTDRGIEYCGHNHPSDFARFGKIMLELKNQKWFMSNAKEWILCNSDDSDDPEDFDEEDLLAHYARNVFACF